MGRHTPGPWRVHDRGPSPVHGVINPNFARWVIFAGDETESRGPSSICDQSIEADAYLIAGGPDMLQALIDFVKYLGDGDTPSERVLVEKAKRAIALATGGGK